MLLFNIPIQRVFNLMNPVGLHYAGSSTQFFNNLELFLKVHTEPLILVYLSCFANDLYYLSTAPLLNVRYYHFTAVDFVLPALIVKASDLYFFLTNIVFLFCHFLCLFLYLIIK